MSFFAALACQRNQPTAHEAMYECHMLAGLDRVGLVNQLVGTWFFDEDDCSAFQGGTRKTIQDAIVFQADQSYSIRNRVNQEILNGQWQLLPANDAGIYELSVFPAIQDLEGLVFICDNKLEINQSFRKGCDIYFLKG